MKNIRFLSRAARKKRARELRELTKYVRSMSEPGPASFWSSIKDLQLRLASSGGKPTHVMMNAQTARDLGIDVGALEIGIDETDDGR